MITKQRLEKTNAIAKAAELEPAVIFESIGEYHVFTEDDVHIVIIEQSRRGYCELICDCKAAKYSNPCYHAAAALTAHIEACRNQGIAVENIKPPNRSGNQADNPSLQDLKARWEQDNAPYLKADSKRKRLMVGSTPV